MHQLPIMRTTSKPAVKLPSKKLGLKKETLKRLGDDHLEQARGGEARLTRDACTSRPTEP